MRDAPEDSRGLETVALCVAAAFGLVLIGLGVARFWALP